MMWFGKYENELTWKEVLVKDPQYCNWVLNQRSSRPGFQEFQRWLMKQAAQPRQAQPRQAKPRQAPPRQSQDDNVVWLFHYTNTDAAKEIRNSQCLLPSIQAKTGDAHEGDGVYFTSLQQNTPYAVLFANNYDGARRKRGQEAYVRVRRNKLPGVIRASTNDRDVWVLPTTKPLDLKKTGAELSWRRARHGDTTVYCF